LSYPKKPEKIKMKGRILKKLFVAILVFILSAVIFRAQIAKTALTFLAARMLGAPVKIESFVFDPSGQSVSISGLKIYNPPGFSRAILVDLSKIDVVYDWQAIKKGKFHLQKIDIELNEMLLERNEKGELNVDSLKVAKEGKEKESVKKSKPLPMQLDLVKLGIGRIVEIQQAAGNKKPVVKAYEVNIHKIYKNISSIQQLALLILTEPMKSAGIRSAKIYGVSMLAGVAVLPVAVAATFMSQDSIKRDFQKDFDIVFDTSLAVLKNLGRVTGQDRASGLIVADLDSARIKLDINKKSDKSTEVVVSARKFFLPRPELAGGVMYEISRELK